MDILRRKKESTHNHSFRVDIDADYADHEKLALFQDDIRRGIANYLLFQNNINYRWPSWVFQATEKESSSGDSLIPPLLLNHHCRDGIIFSNLLPTDQIILDPSGMITTAHDAWSLEFWVSIGGKILRPQERPGQVAQSRDPQSMLTTTLWREKEFDLVQTVFGARASINEAVVELACSLHKKTDSAVMMVVVRPYTLDVLGGIRSVEFNRISRAVAINGGDRFIVQTKPDFILTGNGSDGDISAEGPREENVRSKCRDRLATMALCWKLRKGTQEFRVRIALNRFEKILPMKLDYGKLKREFIEYTGLRMKRGFRLDFPDPMFENWFYASKVSSLNFLKSETALRSGGKTAREMKSLFYVTSAYNRMGYHEESLKIIGTVAGAFRPEKPWSFSDLMAGCYLLCALSDYFTVSRDIDFLNTQFNAVREVAQELYRRSREVKSVDRAFPERRNTLGHYYIGTPLPHDLQLLASALFQFSYLARCIGLFGDEIRFSRESERLEKILVNHFERSYGEAAGEKAAFARRGEFALYDILVCFPFGTPLPGEGVLKKILAGNGGRLAEPPVYLKSKGGWDLFLSLIYAANFLIARDPRAYNLLVPLMERGMGRFILPDVINPRTGRAVLGEGDSTLVVSVLFTVLRNVLFMDYQNRLEIFPLPREDWFKAGSEIVVREAPSRFGPINFRVASTSNEIQFFFNELPKYLPPDILIHLPFKVKIKPEDDFIIKKEMGDSCLINGWPAIVKFTRE